VLLAFGGRCRDEREEENQSDAVSSKQPTITTPACSNRTIQGLKHAQGLAEEREQANRADPYKSRSGKWAVNRLRHYRPPIDPESRATRNLPPERFVISGLTTIRPESRLLLLSTPVPAQITKLRLSFPKKRRGRRRYALVLEGASPRCRQILAFSPYVR